ncbi:MAG: hypothetical protein JW874_15350 [Spirochaetales bacterium]|nr:hypothetical protein [Spirochaetales bacterium]
MKNVCLILLSFLVINPLFSEEEPASEKRLVLLYQVSGMFSTNVPGQFETRDKGFYFFDPATGMSSEIKLHNRDQLMYNWLDIYISDNGGNMVLVYVRANEDDRRLLGHVLKIADETGTVRTTATTHTVSDINNLGDVLLYEWTDKRTHTDLYILDHDTSEESRFFELDFGGYGKAEKFKFDNISGRIWFSAGDNRLGILDGRNISYRTTGDNLQMVDIISDFIIMIHITVVDSRWAGSFKILDKDSFTELTGGTGFTARYNGQNGDIIYDDGITGGNLYYLKDGNSTVIYEKSVFDIPAFPIGWVKLNVLMACAK